MVGKEMGVFGGLYGGIIETAFRPSSTQRNQTGPSVAWQKVQPRILRMDVTSRPTPFQCLHFHHPFTTITITDRIGTRVARLDV